MLAAGCTSGARETASPASGSLSNTYWKLTELDGRAVLDSPNRREPHLRLMADGTRVAGSTGCNNILGRYEQDGDHIRFSALATTRMACLDEEANRQEGAFVEALGQGDRFMVSGDALTLFQGERPRARFAACTSPSCPHPRRGASGAGAGPGGWPGAPCPRHSAA